MNGVNPCIYCSLTAGKILIQLERTLDWSAVELERPSMDDHIQHLTKFSVIKPTMLDLAVEKIKKEGER